MDAQVQAQVAGLGIIIVALLAWNSMQTEVVWVYSICQIMKRQ